MQCSACPPQEGNMSPQMLLVLKLKTLQGPSSCAAVTLLIFTRPYSLDECVFFGTEIELRVFGKESKHCITELYSQPRVRVYLR
jgi:hypothetical protein